jgi:hypothetical protein
LRPPSFRDQEVADPQAHLRGVEVFQRRMVLRGVADGGEDAAEVGVGGEEGGLHQRRVGDGVADGLALGDVAAAFDFDGDELGGAFAVAHDGLGQFGGQRGDGVGQRRRRRCRGDIDLGVAGRAGRSA